MAQTFEHIWTRKPMIVSLSVKVIICFCLSWKNWLHSGLLKNLEQNKLLLNLENFTSHCLENPEIWLVLLIGPLLIRTYCVYGIIWLEICQVWSTRHKVLNYYCPDVPADNQADINKYTIIGENCENNEHNWL